MGRNWVLIVGARPQFIKASALCKAISEHNLCSANKINLDILHTGQHYDNEMSQIFFNELEIPSPKWNLHCDSSDVNLMSKKIIDTLKGENIDKIIVFGDTNSTLSGAICAETLNIPLAHIEAGLRSFNLQMKEEYNRIETDKRSKWLFAPTSVAVKNLENEGIRSGVYNVGDIMFDATKHFSKVSDKKSNILKTLGICPKEYYLVTIHRAENTDNINILRDIFIALGRIDTFNIILPLHPRTAKVINSNIDIQNILSNKKNIKITEPLGFLDIMALEKNAKIIITDSGGMQKEAYFHNVPCITLREETEWIETIDSDNNILCGHNIEKIINAINHSFSMNPISEYGNGDSAKKIIDILIND